MQSSAFALRYKGFKTLALTSICVRWFTVNINALSTQAEYFGHKLADSKPDSFLALSLERLTQCRDTLQLRAKYGCVKNSLRINDMIPVVLNLQSNSRY